MRLALAFAAHFWLLALWRHGRGSDRDFDEERPATAAARRLVWADNRRAIGGGESTRDQSPQSIQLRDLAPPGVPADAFLVQLRTASASRACKHGPLVCTAGGVRRPTPHRRACRDARWTAIRRQQLDDRRNGSRRHGSTQNRPAQQRSRSGHRRCADVCCSRRRDAVQFDEACFVRTVVDKTDAFVGEQVTGTIYLYLRGSLRGAPHVRQEPNTDGFWIHNLLAPDQQLNATRQRVSGRAFNVYTLRRLRRLSAAQWRAQHRRDVARGRTGFALRPVLAPSDRRAEPRWRPNHDPGQGAPGSRSPRGTRRGRTLRADRQVRPRAGPDRATR